MGTQEHLQKDAFKHQIFTNFGHFDHLFGSEPG